MAEDPTEGMAIAATLGDLDGLTSVGTALPGSMSAALRLREPTLLLSLGAPDLAELPQPVLAVVRDEEEARDALDFGARGVLRAGSEPRRVQAAVRAVAAGLRVVDEGLELVAPPVEVPTFDLDPEVPALTPREREVLELLADGLSNKEIAAELDVGERTAKFHVAGLLKKLDATTRTEAVVRAARLGLLLL